jgi:hypothetical protein
VYNSNHHSPLLENSEYIFINQNNRRQRRVKYHISLQGYLYQREDAKIEDKDIFHILFVYKSLSTVVLVGRFMLMKKKNIV